MAAYAIFKGSKPSPSGPGTLLEEEDKIAARILLCVARGHGRRQVGWVFVSASKVAVGSGGKSVLRNILAFSVNVFAFSF